MIFKWFRRRRRLIQEIAWLEKRQAELHADAVALRRFRRGELSRPLPTKADPHIGQYTDIDVRGSDDFGI